MGRVLREGEAGNGSMQPPLMYKELTHRSMEAGKSQELQLACWRPRRADDVVPVQSPETGVSSSLKASGLETQEEPIFQIKSEGRKNLISQPEGSGQEEFSSTYRRVSLFLLLRPSTD